MMGKGPSRVLALAALAAAAVLAGIVLLLSREDPPGAVPTGAASRPTPGPGAGTGTVPAGAGTTDLEGWARRAGSGAPLAVAVAAFLPGGEVLRTDADADGGFRLGGLPRGATVAVEISFPGLATEKLPGLLVPATGRLELPGVVLGSGRRVEARVLAPDGSPVAGARFEILRHSRIGPLPFRPEFQGDTWTTLSEGRADASGCAVLEEVPAGHYRLRASAPGRATAARSLSVTGEGALPRIEFVLGEGATLAVEIRDAEGRPVEGARARAAWGETFLESPPSPSGDFLLEGLEAGTVEVAAILPSGAAAGGGRVVVPSVGNFRITLGEPFTLRGRVRDAGTGEGVAGAMVAFEGRGGFDQVSPGRATTLSLADGAFVLQVPTSDGQAVAAAPGYIEGRWTVRRDRPEALSPDLPLELLLHRSLTVRGRVLDEEGRPIPGARVQLGQSKGPGSFSLGPSVPVRSDGSFSLPGARPGPALVRASARGWWQPGYPAMEGMPRQGRIEFPPSGSVEVPEGGEAALDLVLRRGGLVSGTLLDPAGNPRGGKLILLQRPGDTMPLGVLTAPDGTFTLEGIRPGKDLVLAEVGAGGHRECLPRFDLPEGAVLEGLRVTAPPGPSIHGVVLDDAGKPAPGAKVRILVGTANSFQDPGPAVEDHPCGDDGSFRMEDLNASLPLVLVVRAPGRAEAVIEIAPLGESEDRGPLEVRLAPESPLRGEVVDEEGRPIPGASIQAGFLRERGDTPMRAYRVGPDGTVRAVTDRAGCFVVGGLAAGPRVVRATAPGFLPETRSSEGEAVRLVLLRPRWIGGILREAGTGRPVPGLEVTASPKDGSGGRPGGRGASGADGRFRIEGLGPGLHSVSVATGPSWLPVPASEREAGVDPLLVDLERGYSIAGRVLDEEGRPVASARVSAGAAGKRPSEHATTAADGSFRLGPLREGRYRVAAFPQEWRRGQDRSGAPVPTEVLDVGAGREDLALRLSRGVDLRGRIVDETGRAGDLALSVALLPQGPGKPPEDEVRRTKAAADGTFLFAGVDPGRAWDLVLQGGRAGVGGVLRGVAPGGEAVTLVLDEGVALRGRVLDEGGAPVAGMEVIAVALDARGVEDGIRSTARSKAPFIPTNDVFPRPVESEESKGMEVGEFVLKRLGRFRFRIVVRTGGTDWAPAVLEASSGSGGPVEFRLRRGATLEGRVLGTWERPLFIYAEPADGNQEGITYAGVREDGSFLLRGLAPGPHTLRVNHDSSSKGARTFGPFEAPAAGVEVRWEQGAGR